MIDDILIILFRAKWVVVHGTKYKIGATINIGCNEEELPIFWKIQGIRVLNKCTSSVLFVVSQQETLGFNNHYQSFEVVAPVNGATKIVYTKDFSCFLPLNQVKPVGIQTRTKFICCRVDLEAS